MARELLVAEDEDGVGEVVGQKRREACLWDGDLSATENFPKR